MLSRKDASVDIAASSIVRSPWVLVAALPVFVLLGFGIGGALTVLFQAGGGEARIAAVAGLASWVAVVVSAIAATGTVLALFQLSRQTSATVRQAAASESQLELVRSEAAAAKREVFRDQAERFSFMLQRDRTSDRLKAFGWTIYGLNTSDKPFIDLTLNVFLRSKDEVIQIHTDVLTKFVPPGEGFTYVLPAKVGKTVYPPDGYFFAGGALDPDCFVYFTDAKGTHWVRKVMGKLREGQFPLKGSHIYPESGSAWHSDT
jgi:hypothetical protein